MTFKNNPVPLIEEASSLFKDAVALFKETTVPPIFEEVVELFNTTT